MRFCQQSPFREAHLCFSKADPTVGTYLGHPRYHRGEGLSSFRATLHLAPSSWSGTREGTGLQEQSGRSPVIELEAVARFPPTLCPTPVQLSVCEISGYYFTSVAVFPMCDIELSLEHPSSDQWTQLESKQSPRSSKCYFP